MFANLIVVLADNAVLVAIFAVLGLIVCGITSRIDKKTIREYYENHPS